MRKIVIIGILMLIPFCAWASGGNHVKLDSVNVDLGDKESLQRGAHIFINYCLSCHSARYMRYNRMGKDLGLSDDLVRQHMMFTGDNVGDMMKAVMPKSDAIDWFGAAPPDLTLVARARGADWIYTYLRSFYRDNKSPSGWNNIVFENVNMPHVLYEWQGHQRAVYRTEKKTVDGKEIDIKVFDHFEIAKPGTMDKKQFDEAMRDLINFLVYLGDPAKLSRYTIGIAVMVFLFVFLFVAYLLKRNFWQDIDH